MKATKRILTALALALLTATTAWAQDAITGLTYNSTGGYYEISDAQDLIDLATYVNSGNDASGKTFKQTQDIDMSSAGSFEPIGSQPNNFNPTPFNGTYDGQGHAISGLTVNTSSPYAGLFGYMKGGTVRNLTMVNPNVTANYYSYGGKYASGIVGAIQPGTIENCNVINPTLNPNSADKGAICGAIANSYCVVTDCYYYTTTNYDAVGRNAVELAYSASRTYTLTLNDGITTSTAPAFSYGGTGYYAGTITLPAAPTGWVYEYSVNGSAIDGNTFDISADASVTVNKHISSLLGYDDDPLVDGSAEHPYIISTTEGWNLFCDCLQDNDTWNRFSGKTVRLGDNITVSRMAGDSNHAFTGTFDGGGKTLTVNYANTGNNTMTAPFSYVDGATIQNLIVGGTISGTAYRAAGIIGETVNATSHITNCVSSVDISSGRYTGGFSIGGNVEIEGCVFNGKINGTARSGGFIGYSNSAQVIKNSLFAPQDGSSISGGTFYYNGGVDVAPVNSYYTQALGTAQGKACHSVTAGDNVTIEAVALTGTATQYDVSGITAYSVGGLKCGETLYYGSGDQLSLTLSNSATGAPQGYQYGYTASAGTLSGTTLTMPDQDVTISVNTAALAPIDWATVSDGDSEEDPYMIYNKDQLLLLAHRVNGTNGETANTYEGMYFKLGADITFDHDANETDDYAENYEAIGGYIGGTFRYFCGSFDGDGYTVSGIRIRKTGSDTANNNQGLFGRIGSGADIHDVHLTDARITGYQSVGGIAGLNVDGYIRRCSVTDSYITATTKSNYGTICGNTSKTSLLANNYYHGCTVNGTAVTSGVGCKGADIAANNGALPAYRLDLGDGVSTTALASAPENGFVYNAVSYYREGLALPLASTLGSEAPEGYTLSFSANGTALSGNTYTVNSTDGDVTITAAIRSDGLQHEVSYIDADGSTQTAQAIALDGTETNLAAGWYVVQGTVNYTTGLVLDGDTHIILADGSAMNIGTEQSPVENVSPFYSHGFFGYQYDLSIYAQSGNTGSLSIYSKNSFGVNNLTIAGGNIHCNSSIAFYQNSGNIVFKRANIENTNGGGLAIFAGNLTATDCQLQIEASQGIIQVNNAITFNNVSANLSGCSSGYSCGIYCTDFTVNHSRLEVFVYKNAAIEASGIITLGCTDATDYIKATCTNSYYLPYCYIGTVKIADGQTLYVGTNAYTGTLTDAERMAIGGQTLTNVAPPTYSYIGLDGTEVTGQMAIIINADNMPTSLSGWYIVQGTVNYTTGLVLDGETHIILADNAVMNVTSGSSRGINSVSGNSYSLFVHGQSGRNGKLTVTSSSDDAIHIVSGDITIVGCEVDATGSKGIYVEKYNGNGGNLTIKDATVEATGTSSWGYGIHAVGGGDITIDNSNVTAKSTSNLAILSEGGGNITIQNGGKTIANGSNIAIYNFGGDITIDGCEVEATGATGIYVQKYKGNGGNLTIKDATVTATGTSSYGIQAYGGGDITLNLSDASDYITVSSYAGTVKVADGKAFTDGNGHIYAGTLTDDETSALAGKTLRPCLALADDIIGDETLANNDGMTLTVALANRTIDTEWNTLTVPFDVSAEQLTETFGAGVKLYELTGSSLVDDVLGLEFTSATSIEAGKPYFIKASADVQTPTFQGVTIDASANNTSWTNYVDFIPTLGVTKVEGSDLREVLVLGAGNTLYNPSVLPAMMKGFRGFFRVHGVAANAAQFRMTFAEESEISGIFRVASDNGTDGCIYNLMGQKVNRAEKGLFIVKGKRVIRP